MNTEQWLPIDGYEGSYEVSDLGRVRSLDRMVPCGGGSERFARGRVLKQGTQSAGYQLVVLCCEGISTSCLVSRLVLLAFVGPGSDGDFAMIINGERADCRLVNLRWTHCNRGDRYKRR